MSRLAGVVVEHEAGRRFISAEFVQRIVRPVAISAVPGTRLGLTFFQGRVISVLALGNAQDELLVCDVQGELVALSGLRVLASGFFEAAADGVRMDSEVVPAFDVASEVAGWEQRFWSHFRPQGEHA
jgi:hypothetical protein